MNYTKKEVLRLDKMSDKDLFMWLRNNGILKQKRTGLIEDCYESLADCAFRLRDETRIGDLHEAQRELMFHVPTHQMNRASFWIFKAKPIHWIQAALLAKLESEE